MKQFRNLVKNVGIRLIVLPFAIVTAVHHTLFVDYKSLSWRER